ncbi:MAG: hypothetical protein M3Z17_08935 [Gemmatimonadota bacterium]|nr:hypothetical protein [Gemmatimonadota bacterium]
MDAMDSSSSEPGDSVVAAARRIIAAREAEVLHYAILYPLLLGEIPEIMSAWDRSTEELPWSGLEASSRQNNLVSVITRVIDCAMGSASRAERVNALIQAASNHGDSRRKQDVGMEVIFSEYDKLRAATWRKLRDLVEMPTSLDAIFVIDGLLSVASRATALGYHRAEMEESGLYDKQIEELKKTVRS